MENRYRLEFSETQQQFHLDNRNHEPNSYGWVTIADNCSDIEFEALQSYMNIYPVKRLSEKHIRKCLAEVSRFILRLTDFNLSIKRE